MWEVMLTVNSTNLQDIQHSCEWQPYGFKQWISLPNQELAWIQKERGNHSPWVVLESNSKYILDLSHYHEWFIGCCTIMKIHFKRYVPRLQLYMAILELSVSFLPTENWHSKHSLTCRLDLEGKVMRTHYSNQTRDSFLNIPIEGRSLPQSSGQIWWLDVSKPHHVQTQSRYEETRNPRKEIKILVEFHNLHLYIIVLPWKSYNVCNNYQEINSETIKVIALSRSQLRPISGIWAAIILAKILPYLKCKGDQEV